jgi:cytochrome c oxidase subunit I
MSTIGSFIFGLGLFMILGYLLKSLKSGEKAPHNPWGGMSMEWVAATPPIEHNFEVQPVCTHGPYDFPEIEVNRHGGGH